MICPQTKAGCQFACKDIAGCQLQLAPYEFCDAKKTISISSNGEVVADPCVTSFRAHPTADGWALESFAVLYKPKPTLAEIERLVDAFESAVCGKIYYPDSDSFEADYDLAKQKLLATFNNIMSPKATRDDSHPDA